MKGKKVMVPDDKHDPAKMNKDIPAKEQKHIVILHTLKDLKGNIDRFDVLIDKITKNDKANDEKEKEMEILTSMSLINFLESTPEKINILSKRVQEIQEKLDSLLF